MLDVEPNKVKKISHVITQFPAVQSLGREKQDVFFQNEVLSVPVSFWFHCFMREKEGNYDA